MALSNANKAVANIMEEKTVSKASGMPVSPSARKPTHDSTTAGNEQPIIAKIDNKYDFRGEGR